MPRRKTEPQISPNLFKPLMELDTIKKGTRIYKMLDQSEVHWQFKMLYIQGSCEQGLICRDANDKPHLVEDISNWYIFIGHVESKEHLALLQQ